jgi:hypothetical protein
MSTPNFSLMNASRYFVLGMPVYYTQEKIDERELDQNLLGEFDEIGTERLFQDTQHNVAYELKAKGWHDIEECDGDRSYPTSLFSEKTVSIKCGDNTIDVTIQAGCTSGYYQAANFDWFVSIKTYRRVDYYYETCDYDYNDLTADDVIRDDWYENKGLSKIHAAHIIRKIEAVIDDLKNEAECAFSKYCDEEMFCAWNAFNGEAGYSTAGKRLWQELEELNKKTA